MFLLGEMRAVEAGEVLAEYIGFPQVLPADVRDLVPERGGFRPHWLAAEALLKIGRPAISHVMRKLSETDHTTERRACLAVLLALAGREDASAALTSTIKRETDLRKRSRLEQALGVLPRAGTDVQLPGLEVPSWLRPPEADTRAPETG